MLNRHALRAHVDRAITTLRGRLQRAAAPAAAVGAGVPAVEPLEGRLMFAVSLATGGSGYSGTLSTNKTIREQQLNCDPAEPKAGSTSVRYDPAVVTLTGVQPGPGYDNLGFIGLIEVMPKGATKSVLQPLVAFLQNPLGREMGYVQIKYQLSGQAGKIPVWNGFTQVDHDGPLGVDTHAFRFAYKPGVSADANAKFQIYAERANQRANNAEDFLVTNDGTNTRLGPNLLSAAFVSSNAAPTITSAGGPYTIAEGAGVTLHAAATDVDSPLSALTYAWDLNSDGTTDVTGKDPAVSAALLKTLGLGDGPKAATVKLTVSDGDKSATKTTPLTVTNVAPTASVSVGTEGTTATNAVITLAATDPSAADVAAGFKYVINWGDGTAPQTVTGGATATASHRYAGVGAFAVSVTATDKDGGTSAAATAEAGVAGASLRPDPSNPTKLALYVVGTNSNNVIRFTKSGNGSTVTMDGKNLGTFGGFGRIIALGRGGNDDIQLSYQAAAEVVMFGGDGDDTLIAGNYLTLLNGGDGRDTLSSGNAKDLVIGGGGADSLKGGDGDDLVAAGRTTYDGGSDADVRALTAIFREWAGGASYETRIARITGAATGGVNGTSLLKPGTTIFDDAVADSVLGGNGRDWLLLRRGTGAIDASDLVTGETGTPL